MGDIALRIKNLAQSLNLQQVINIGTKISFEHFPADRLAGVHKNEWRRIASFDPPNFNKGEHLMRYNIINNLSVILAMVSTFILSSNTFGQDMGAGSHREGYGSYDTMGQNPDDIIKYGEDMMRYGFREMGMSGGSSKYPGYNRNLSDATIKKLNTEQEAFIKATEDLRQTIYEKELYLKAELVKKDPDTATALGFQKNISEAKGKFEQKMIEHIIRMKKIDLTAEKR